MNILTIDTSDRSIVGLAVESEERTRKVAADARHHAETLTPMVQEALGGVTPDAIVAGTGPAAFTGLRAGLMTARALGRAWQVPVYGVSSLDVLALAAVDAGANEVLAVIDARRKELFVQRFRALGPDDVEALTEPSIVKPADIPALLAGEPAVLATARPELYPELAAAERVECSPAVMARLALSRLHRQEAGEAVSLGTEPQYLRRPDIHQK